MKKFFDILLLLIGIVFIGTGIYFINNDKKIEDKIDEKPIVKIENNYTKYLENTCWEKEMISEESSDDISKAICFYSDGTFTYKYLRGENNEVEGFEGYNKFTYKDDIITLYKDGEEDINISIYNINKDRLTIKYDDRLVYFLYYCAL